MKHVLVRSCRDPFSVQRPETVLADRLMASNSGNLMFQQAMHITLDAPGQEVTSNSLINPGKRHRDEYVAAANERFDQYVIPLANAFRMSFAPNLRRLAAVIDRLEMPVICVGVGAQQEASTTGDLTDAVVHNEELDGAVTAFVSAVLDHSASIGVRGEHTAAYLASLGFGDEHVDVIGCPSLFSRGRDLRIGLTPAISDDSALAVTITPSRPQLAPVVEHNRQRYADLMFIAQHTNRLELLLWGENESGTHNPAFPVHPEHPMYLNNQIRYFVDVPPWLRYLRERDFSFGTRIHGTIASILAETPAHLLYIDSRTQELADYHRIPSSALKTVGNGDAADLAARTDYAEFNATHPELFDRFVEFLARNEITNTWAHGDGGVSYWDRLNATDFPAPVQCELVPGVDPEARGRREIWLRERESGSPAAHYTAPWDPRILASDAEPAPDQPAPDQAGSDQADSDQAGSDQADESGNDSGASRKWPRSVARLLRPTGRRPS